MKITFPTIFGTLCVLFILGLLCLATYNTYHPTVKPHKPKPVEWSVQTNGSFELYINDKHRLQINTPFFKLHIKDGH